MKIWEQLFFRTYLHAEVDLGLPQQPTTWLPAVNYYHKALHLGCCCSPRSASVHEFFSLTFWGCHKIYYLKLWVLERSKSKTITTFSNLLNIPASYAISIHMFQINKRNIRTSC